MTELTPVTRTAMGAAIMRACHLRFDGEPKIFNDSHVQRILGLNDEELSGIRARLPMASSPWVLRSRYAEDRLAQAVVSGARQYLAMLR